MTVKTAVGYGLLGLLGVLITICLIVLSITCWVAMIEGLVHWLGWPLWLAIFVSFIFGIVLNGVRWISCLFTKKARSIGGIIVWISLVLLLIGGAGLGVVGAHLGWGWKLSSSILLLMWWPVGMIVVWVFNLIGED